MSNVPLPNPGEFWIKKACKDHADAPVGKWKIPANFGKHPCASCNARLEYIVEWIKCGCFVLARNQGAGLKLVQP